MVGDRRGIVNGSKASQTERVLGSKEVPATETIPASSITTPPKLWIVETSFHYSLKHSNLVPVKELGKNIG